MCVCAHACVYTCVRIWLNVHLMFAAAQLRSASQQGMGSQGLGTAAVSNKSDLTRFVGWIKLLVSFAEYCLFYRALWQKRPMIDKSDWSYPIWRDNRLRCFLIRWSTVRGGKEKALFSCVVRWGWKGPPRCLQCFFAGAVCIWFVCVCGGEVLDSMHVWGGYGQ